MTVTSNWLPFIAGASLHILSDNATKDIEKLLYFIDEEKINFLNVTPSPFFNVGKYVGIFGETCKPITQYDYYAGC